MKAIIILSLIIIILGSGAISHSSRTPSSIVSEIKKPEALLTRISSARQRPDITKKRIAAINTPFEFMRAFPSFFWWNLKALKKNQDFQSLLKVDGIILGDLHLENFGTLVHRDSQVTAFMNDFDDITEGPFILDIMRLLLSIDLSQKIGNAEINQYDWWQDYFAGIKGEPLRSNIVDRIVEKATSVATELADNIEWQNEKLSFSKRRDDSRDLSAKEQFSTKQWTKIISKEYALPELLRHDNYARQKWSGGSGGLVRYYNLYESQKSAFVFEIKPLVRPAPDYYTKKTYMQLNRVKELNGYLKRLGLQNLVNISLNRGSNSNQIRMKIKGEEEINPLAKNKDGADKYSYEEKLELVRYQIQLVGKIHGQQLTIEQRRQYIEQIDLTKSVLNKTLNQLKALHISTFQQIKK